MRSRRNVIYIKNKLRRHNPKNQVEPYYEKVEINYDQQYV